MSITVTLKEIVDAREALMNLSQQKLNIKIGYNVSKIIKKANEELEHLTKARQEIIDRHVVLGEEMTQEVNDAIVNELGLLLSLETEIPVNKVDLSELNIELTPRDILALDSFCIFDTVTLA